ncbi:hypothetical protein PoB_004192100 [Plakobranchus ocellatus]|uniref:Uncharacterized protein n=1 Tax=Plakobranchus ocellatus TaxID=259542 RepID=A0AAV4AWC6_9GAST|nr:hypothetical protein PoB_004192100 [Plakobranchus ocellatus]
MIANVCSRQGLQSYLLRYIIASLRNPGVGGTVDSEFALRSALGSFREGEKHVESGLSVGYLGFPTGAGSGTSCTAVISNTVPATKYFD